MVTPDGGGLRYNSDKPSFALIPHEFLFALAEHFTRGAKKYKPRNWERGMDWSHCFDAIQRHSWAWWGGEDNDPETGSNHMVAVAWNAAALLVYTIRGIGRDNRPQGQAPQETQAQLGGQGAEAEQSLRPEAN